MRLRQIRRPTLQAEKVFILSRVTLGADIAVTSVILDAVKKRFPNSEIFFVGGRKNWELFAADCRLGHAPVQYDRGGTLPGRLAAGTALRKALSGSEAIVVDPDSRLTQLGLLPVCSEDRYYFFESRAFGQSGMESLGGLAKRWAVEVFDVHDARPYIAPEQTNESTPSADITVSFGVGDNPLKRVPDPFEEELLAGLAATGASLLVDKGAEAWEAERVERAIAGLGTAGSKVRTWDGAFAPFALAIARSRLYVGYDLAGQHVAATCGTPLVCVFSGFASERAFRRASYGSGPIAVVRVESQDSGTILKNTMSAVTKFLGAPDS